MLPQLDTISPPNSLHRRFAEALQEAGFVGDVQLDFASRLVQSTDNSIYQRLPQGVLYPADTDDLVRIAGLSCTEEFQSLQFFARGGGTGTNGQSLGDGFIVDVSRHMNRILDINVEEGWARVQAGVVKDQLNGAVRQHGLFFAPDLSTSNRATIGGMISTDASGQGSCRYGKTRHHVLTIDTVLNDGQLWSSKALTNEEFAAISQQNNRIGQIHQLLDKIHRENRPAIERIFPPLNRSLSGYDLAHVWDEEGRNEESRDEEGRFNLNNIICGSEGSLGFIAEAVVNLERLPSHKALVLIGYNDFVAALADCQNLMTAEVTSIESLDNVVMELARTDALWPAIARYFPSSDLALAAINLLELAAHSDHELQQQMEAVSQHLISSADNPHRLTHSMIQDAEAMSTLWTLRKRAVGLLGNLPGHARPLPFVEDCAVAPARLPNFIADFRALLDSEGLRYGMFGHGDAGVIHVRPALDLREPDSMATIRRVSDQVFALTQRYGGILWGEHGKGLRSAYSPDTFGELYPQLQRIKAAFDPHNQFNPGKVATPNNDDTLLAIDAVPTRGQRDALIPVQSWDDFPEAVYCNGNAACFNWDPDQSMCPSWKGTRERKYSPKGRATLMKEWLAQLGEQGYTVRRGAAPQSHWTTRWFGWLKPKSDDFAHQVYDAMDSCLACKTCATGCPVQVDVPTFRSIFFSHYFSRYRRPLRHYAIAALETALPMAARFPSLYRLASESRGGQFLLKNLGLTAIPRLQPTNFRAVNVEVAESQRLMNLPEEEKQRSVILVQDVFTHYLDGQVVEDICRFLQALGFRVWHTPGWHNGKPLHVLGFLQRFGKTARRTAAALNELARSGVPLVGIEPSMNLIYRNDYQDYLGGDPAPPVMLLQEWLAQQAPQLEQYRESFNPAHYRLLPHCSEAAIAGESMKDWQAIFKALGSALTIEQVGCCGMAGTYGHEAQYADTSQRIYQLSWAPKLQDSSNTCVSGFSCRSQVERFDGQRLPHPLQTLLAQLKT